MASFGFASFPHRSDGPDHRREACSLYPWHPVRAGASMALWSSGCSVSRSPPAAGGLIFHLAAQGAFPAWLHSPLSVLPASYAFWDPHAGAGFCATLPTHGPARAGADTVLASLGFAADPSLLAGAAALLALAAGLLLARACTCQRLNPPPCLGAASFAWAGHLAALFGVDGQALSALAALNPSTSSLWPGDLIHHHAAAGLAGCWMGCASAPCRALPGRS